MIKQTFNPLSGNFDSVLSIPQLDSDPSSLSPEDMWVLKTGVSGSGGGKIISFLGLGFVALTTNSPSTLLYRLSFRTKEGTTVRTTLS